ncbi:MAG: hypothetical protein ACM3XZ_02480 [Betaproteobacteria bacterium]
MGFWTLLIASGVAYTSNAVLSKVGLVPAFSLLAAIVVLNVAADIVGTAAAASEEPPLHAMAANQVPGARQAIQLVRRADIVANIMNDLLGDIFGTISGAVGAGIAVLLAVRSDMRTWLNALLIACIAAATVGGKAAGKAFAIRRANQVMLFLGYLVYRAECLTGLRFLDSKRARRPRTDGPRRR